MKSFVDPHCHVKSLDSASTPKQFAKREVELGTGYVTVTDHGVLDATRTVYDLCAKGGKFHGKLKPILGLEGYFRDDNDPLLKAAGIVPTLSKKTGAMTYEQYYKYSHITLHATDEQAYFALVKKLSDADLRAEQHGSERKPLFDWPVLEELGSYNMTGTSGCLIGMVGRHLLQNNDAKMAAKFYEKVRSCFKPGNFYVEMFPHVTDKFFQSAVYCKFEDGTTKDFPAYRKLQTDSEKDEGGIKAEDLASDFSKDPSKARARHRRIRNVMEQRKWTGVGFDSPLVSVELRQGFVHNECLPWCVHGDYQLEVNRFIFALAKKYGDSVLISDDAHFAYPEEKIIQDVRLNGWRFAQSHHRMSSDEAFAYFNTKLGVSESTFEGWVENSYQWAEKFNDFKFSPRNALPTAFYPEDTLAHTFKLIKKHKRLDPKNPEQVERLKAELQLLHRSGIDLLSYFMVGEEVCDLYLRKGVLAGPGRGSAAGLEAAYLLNITHVNPREYELSMDRFMTPDRVASGKLPDIDQDLPSRDLLVDPKDPEKGWLKERFGANVAQMSVDIQLKLKNAIKDVHRIKDGFVSAEINDLTTKLPDPPQGIDSKDYVFGYEIDDVYTEGLLETNKVLQNYVAKYPDQWEAVHGLLGLSRQKGRHPCGYVISSQPIDSFIPMTTVGGVRVTSFTAASVEAMGGLKMDFLTVRSIGDIDNAIKLIQSRYAPTLLPDGKTVNYVKSFKGRETPTLRVVPFEGQYHDIWDLPLDESVFVDICKGKVETVFQLDGPAARTGLRSFPLLPDGRPPLKSMEDLSAFTALDRPGPLDAYVTDENGQSHNMLVEYANRARGEPGIGRVKVLDELVQKTYGIIVYQEQLQAIFKEIGGTTGIQANDFRQRIGKKKLVEVRQIDKPLFMAGAIPKLGEEEAERLWGMMETFGQYGFNKSHAVCYMHTAYACAWLKHHFPLEWWTAVLSNAARNDIDDKFWRYIGNTVLMPDVSKLQNSFQIEGNKIRAPVWLIHGIGEKAHALLMHLGPFTDISDFVRKIDNWRIENATPTTKKDKKSGEMVPVMKKAHNPLNDTIVSKLIICHAFDTLFPEEIDGLPVDTTDRLTMFAVAAKQIRGTKVKPFSAKFNLTSPAAKYQLTKSIMPAYSEPLLPLFRGMAPQKFIDHSANVVRYLADDKDTYAVLTGDQFEWIETLETLPGNEMSIALPAFVVSQRTFDYSNNTKTACELVLDIDGVRRNFVKWPSKDKGLPPEFKQKLEGGFVVALFGRRNPTDDFFFRGLEVVESPHIPEAEESPIDD